MDKQKMYIRNVKINVDNRAKAIEIEVGEVESPGWLERDVWEMAVNGILEFLNTLKLDREERKKLMERLEQKIKVEVKKALKDDGKANK